MVGGARPWPPGPPSGRRRGASLRRAKAGRRTMGSDTNSGDGGPAPGLPPGATGCASVPAPRALAQPVAPERTRQPATDPWETYESVGRPAGPDAGEVATVAGLRDEVARRFGVAPGVVRVVRA